MNGWTALTAEETGVGLLSVWPLMLRPSWLGYAACPLAVASLGLEVGGQCKTTVDYVSDLMASEGTDPARRVASAIPIIGAEKVQVARMAHFIVTKVGVATHGPI